jgi:hypothetical protein
VVLLSEFVLLSNVLLIELPPLTWRILPQRLAVGNGERVKIG